ncbi:MAG: YkgJ family cysteine cluster protein [Bdellovibrionales bacterium]
MDSFNQDLEVAHPCVRCGACCATYRVLFPVQELQSDSYHVPADLTEAVDPGTRAMMGTNQQRPRCVALAGRIGVDVMCSIYERRPGCCRQFVPSYENGRPNRSCDHAQTNKGLKPLAPHDWVRYRQSPWPT